MPHGPEREPSPFVLAHLGALLATAALGPALVLACGRGRHTALLAGRGLRVVALDLDPEALRSAAGATAARPLDLVRADAEAASGLPFRGASFGAALVSRFLFRPLAAELTALLRPGGLLLYETFTIRQRDLGYGPKNPAFLLEEQELPALFPGLRVIDHREGCRSTPRGEWLASLLAMKA